MTNCTYVYIEIVFHLLSKKANTHISHECFDLVLPIKTALICNT